MADQESGKLPDPTRVEGGDEPSTVDAPSRWSGSATVPPPTPKKSRWSRRRAEEDERTAVPAVDPWAGHDTPVDPMPVAVVDPTKIELPAPPAPPAPAPVPVPLPTAPRKPTRREKREKKAQAKQLQPVNRLPVQTRPPTPPAPPPWATPRPPERPLPPPRRKRRRGRLFLFALLGVLCCCGLPFAYFQFPAARQYPVSADLPTDFSDLSLRDDSASKRAADRLAQDLKAAKARDGKPFAGVYGDSRGKRVTIFGVTGWRFTPKGDVRAQLDRLADDFNLSGVTSFNLGETGAHESCGVGRADGNAVVVCAWADHGSMATVLLTRRNIKDSADLVGRLRSAVLTPG
ncbi:hypothetical protein [Paractinoplanes globisporus]|uniref:Uncharacterized protein n=1 Tax=Paractinoplanes globisporus TaxID=113565 RepID=A0ABW6WI60_9ACTN|nr:hypothetical protein [Actinoplanes globisporus]